MESRIILMCIRNLRYSPCPRCLIRLSQVEGMGGARDRKQRKTLARVDNETRRRKVNTACDIIYNKHYAIDYDGVEALLKEQSLIPTLAST